MGYIVCLIGPSGSGKSTIAKEMITRYKFKSLPIHTNRPIRKNENGNSNYIHHTSFQAPFPDGKPKNIVWTFCTSFMYDGQKKNIQYWHTFTPEVIATDHVYLLESINPSILGTMQEVYGKAVVVPIILERPFNTRMNACIQRELAMSDKIIDWSEIFRRYTADEIDFKRSDIRLSCKDEFIGKLNIVDVDDDIEKTMQNVNLVLREALVSSTRACHF